MFSDDLAVTLTDTGIVNVLPSYQQTTRPGAGFVHLGQARRSDDRWGVIREWRVVIVLDQNVHTASEWIEANLDTLISACRAVGEWMTADFTPINLAGAETNAVVLTVIEAR
ncbi:MAG: hypothetical protein ACRCZD_12710 [Phycicoccus sp.]